MYQYPNYLAHHGVKGMKWGVRRAKKKQMNERYTESRQKQDERLYGKRSVKRINKRLNKGESLVSARHAEVVRRDKKASAKKNAKTAAKVGASIVSTVAGIAAADIVYNDAKLTKSVINATKAL